MPRRPSVETIVALTPTISGVNTRAATTQYRSPTAEESAELRTSAMPSRFCGSRQPVACDFTLARAEGAARASEGITRSSCRAPRVTPSAG
jgi:hypothetical protein